MALVAIIILSIIISSDASYSRSKAKMGSPSSQISKPSIPGFNPRRGGGRPGSPSSKLGVPYVPLSPGGEREKLSPQTRLKMELSDESMTLNGRLTFSKTVGQLPAPSCITLNLRERTKSDYSDILATKQIDVSGQKLHRTLAYTFETRKPLAKYLTGQYQFGVDAVLNVGWCKGEKSFPWLKKGDYLSEKRHEVKITRDEDNYLRNIDLVFYGNPQKARAGTGTGTGTTQRKYEDNCAEGVPIVACADDPCQGAECEGYKDAECVVNMCGVCNAVFYENKRQVTCENDGQ